MSLLEHTHETPAPPAEVWAVLLDLDGWTRWNTLTARAPQGIAVGSPLALGIRLGPLTIPASARFVRVEPERHLIWQGGVRGVFRAVHGFDLQPTASGGTRIRHHEDFAGLLHRPMLAVLGQRQRDVYGLVNRRLAAEAEAR